MFEVEAKVGLRKKNYLSLIRVFKAQGKKIAPLTKTDTYYGEQKDFFLRIREENKKTVLTLKFKDIRQGRELNQELDIPIKSKKIFEKLLGRLGLKPFAKKQKKNLTFLYKGAHVELNWIEGLGHFLEIEVLAKTKKEIPKAQKKVDELFRDFGFSSADYEKKYYLDLLNEKGLI